MPIPYCEQAPPPALARWVECFWCIDSPVAVADYGVAPDGGLDIIYSPGGGLRAIGAMTRERRYSLPAASQPIGVRFQPGMAGAFLKTPPGELTDAEIPLEDLWGAPARSLERRLADAESRAERAALLSSALRPPDTAPDSVQQAIAAIASTHGQADLDAMARQANLSPRQFRRRCLGASGLSPKHLCRVLRFRNATELAARTPGLKWSLIALDAGYFDQAHLIRDFREFTGRSPMSVFSNTGEGATR